MRSSSTRSYAIAIGTTESSLAIGLERRLEQAGLRRLQLAAVAAAALGVIEEVAPLEQLRDVRAERHEIERVLAVAADRDRARHVPMEQAERAAEQIDARRRAAAAGRRGRRARAARSDSRDGSCDSRRRRRVRGASPSRRARRVRRCVPDLPENRIERMLQRAIEPVPLRRPQLVEIALRCAAGRPPPTCPGRRAGIWRRHRAPGRPV